MRPLRQASLPSSLIEPRRTAGLTLHGRGAPEVGICQEAGGEAQQMDEKAAFLPPDRQLLGRKTGEIDGLMLLVN
jgi:hypothetical protein